MNRRGVLGASVEGSLGVSIGVAATRSFGAEPVAIGTDVAYSSRQMGAEQKRVPKTGPARKRWESFWPADAIKRSGNPLSMAWTNRPMSTERMVQRGRSGGDPGGSRGQHVSRSAGRVGPVTLASRVLHLRFSFGKSGRSVLRSGAMGLRPDAGGW